MPQRVCLVMIVKNEAPVIERCLNSVLPFVDCAVIHDTGSTDNTKRLVWELICSKFNPLYHTLKSRPWVNFGVNRTELLHDASETDADYIFTIDADEEFISDGSQRPIFTHDLYDFHVEYAGTTYVRPTLFRNDGGWVYKGAIHEYLARGREGNFTRATNEWGHVKVYHEGARSRDPLTYRKDAKILQDFIFKEDPTTFDYARNLYYLAQSYRDAGMFPDALSAYKQRAKLKTGWYEEAWHAQFQAGHIAKQLHGTAEGIWEYMKAYNMDPTRAEPLYYAAMALDKEHVLKEMFLRKVQYLPLPTSGLFLEPHIYKWLVRLQLSVSCWYLGKTTESRKLTESLLGDQDLPSNYRKTLEDNLKFF